MADVQSAAVVRLENRPNLNGRGRRVGKEQIFAPARHLNDAYKDVRGAKVTKQGQKSALLRPCVPWSTDGILKQLREKSDYDDFYVASKEQAKSQVETAELILNSVLAYLEMEKE